MMKQRQGSGFLGQEKIGYQQMVQSVRKNGERSQGLSVAAWPTLPKSQQKRELQPGSGMRAVFLGDRGTKKERSGTGVFLPRRFEPATGTRKKPGLLSRPLKINFIMCKSLVFTQHDFGCL